MSQNEHVQQPGNAATMQPDDGTTASPRYAQLQGDIPSSGKDINNRSSSPSLSSKSGRTSSRTDSTSGSSGLPQISTPSSSVYVTPDGLTPINPFASLSISQEVDALANIANAESGQDEHRPLLTAESLRPYGGGRKRSGKPGASTSTVSTPSVASSSEAKDLLGPLPVARPGMPERPSSRIVQQHHQQQQQQHQEIQERYQRHLIEQQKQQELHLQPSPPTPRSPPTSSSRPSPRPGHGFSPISSPNPGSTSTFRSSSSAGPSFSPMSSPNPGSTSAFRIHLPSPPALGLSELLSGSPVTPGNETSYFSGVHSEPSTLSRSVSGSRRAPTYSPFRSYYGPSISDQPRRSELEQERSLQRPPIAPIVSSGSSVSTVSKPHKSDKPPSDGASTISTGSSKSARSPRIKNIGVLAPHGSFTSARTRPISADMPKKIPGAASDSALYLGNIRRPAAVEGVDDSARDALQAAAFKGDQLAMYRLGWKADTPTGQRYKIGSIENVWGAASPYPSETRRSSVSSRGSVGSAATTPLERPTNYKRDPDSDLFADAAGLALRDNASKQNASKTPAKVERRVSRS